MPQNLQRTRPGIGTTALVFMIIAASAPLTVLAGGVPTNFAVAGILGVPLGYLAIGLIILLFTVGYVAMSRSISNAGAFYAYITEGLGNRQGIAAAILALVSYNLMQCGLYGLFGFSLAAFLSTLFGIHISWWVAALLGWVCVGLLGVASIDLSAKILGLLVALEFLVVIIVSALALTEPPEGISSQTIEPQDFFTTGIGVLLAFSIAAFMGFESGAIYSEEVKDRKRTVARATYIAVTLIALFYAGTAWAFAMGVGPSAIIAQAQEYGPDLVFVWLAERSPALAHTANALFITSLFAALLAFHNAAARYFFSLGRSRVLPGLLGRASTSGSPLYGSALQTVLALLVLLIFAVLGQNSEHGELYPVLTLFTWFTNAAAFGLVFLLTITSVAVICWFARNPADHSLWVRLIAPGVSALALAVVAFLILWNFDIMIGSQDGSPLVYVMPAVIMGSGVLGLAWGHYLKHRRPDVYQAIRHLDHQESTDPGSQPS
ncbi:APC family permease [Rothia sp. P5764]|uniref:APC family permease n=1 Tax=Rothia sp. P5764 TaxID=3402654 RepID=UPI003AC945EF